MAPASSVLALLRAYKPVLTNAEEQAAFAVHLTLLAQGFELLASGEKASESSGAPPDDPLEGWKDTPGEAAFLYALPPPPPPSQNDKAQAEAGGSRKAILKCLSVGEVMMVDACQVGVTDAPVVHAEFRPADYVAAARSQPSTSYSTLYKNLDSLVTLVDSTIAQPLIKGQGAAPADQNAGRATGSAEAGETLARGGRGGTGVDRDGAGGGNDEWAPPQRRGGPVPGVVYPPFPDPGGIGDDLMPGGGAGIMPQRGPNFPVSGMLVGPHDPRWGGMGRPGPGIDDPDSLIDPDSMPYGRPGNLPPGTRFDPFGPPGMPGFEPGRFGEDRGRRGPPGFNRDLQFF